MLRRPPIYTPRYTRLPYTTRFRSFPIDIEQRAKIGEIGIVPEKQRETRAVRAGIERLDDPAHQRPGGGRVHVIGPVLVMEFDRVEAQQRLDLIARHPAPADQIPLRERSEEHTSELQSIMRISYAVIRLNKKNNTKQQKAPQN